MTFDEFAELEYLIRLMYVVLAFEAEFLYFIIHPPFPPPKNLSQKSASVDENGLNGLLQTFNGGTTTER